MIKIDLMFMVINWNYWELFYKIIDRKEKK